MNRLEDCKELANKLHAKITGILNELGVPPILAIVVLGDRLSSIMVDIFNEEESKEFILVLAQQVVELYKEKNNA